MCMLEEYKVILKTNQVVTIKSQGYISSSEDESQTQNLQHVLGKNAFKI